MDLWAALFANRFHTSSSKHPQRPRCRSRAWKYLELPGFLTASLSLDSDERVNRTSSKQSHHESRNLALAYQQFPSSSPSLPSFFPYLSHGNTCTHTTKPNPFTVSDHRIIPSTHAPTSRKTSSATTTHDEATPPRPHAPPQPPRPRNLRPTTRPYHPQRRPPQQQQQHHHPQHHLTALRLHPPRHTRLRPRLLRAQRPGRGHLHDLRAVSRRREYHAYPPAISQFSRLNREFS